MNGKKITFLIIDGVLTLALTAASAYFGINKRLSYIASTQAADMTAELVSENEQLKTRRDILKNDVGSKTDDTPYKDELNTKIAERTGEITAMKTETETAKKSIEETKSKTEAASKTLNSLNAGMNLSRGKSVEVGTGGLQCPDTIGAGRYIAEGDGVLTIIAANGAARVSEDLLTIDTGTYTFDLAEGERVKTNNGNITLTELK